MQILHKLISLTTHTDLVAVILDVASIFVSSDYAAREYPGNDCLVQ